MDQKNKTEIDFEIFDYEVDRGHELLILSYQEKRKQKFKMFYLITKSVEIHFGSYLVLGHLDMSHKLIHFIFFCFFCMFRLGYKQVCKQASHLLWKLWSYRKKDTWLNKCQFNPRLVYNCLLEKKVVQNRYLNFCGRNEIYLYCFLHFIPFIDFC